MSSLKHHQHHSANSTRRILATCGVLLLIAIAVLSFRHSTTRKTTAPSVTAAGSSVNQPAARTASLVEQRTGAVTRMPAEDGQRPSNSPPPPSPLLAVGKPFEQQQLELLQFNLMKFDGAQTVESARDVLWREAVVTLYGRGEFLAGPEAEIELERPGYNTVSLDSEYGRKLFYISEREFPEYAEVLRLARTSTDSSAPLNSELVRRIRTRVVDTLWRSGVTTQQ